VADVWDWLFECVEGANRSGEGCGYPNLLVLLVPAGLAFVFASFRWTRSLRRGEPRPEVTTLEWVLVFGSLGLAGVVALVGAAVR
jgi:hypothetical protein